MDDLNALRCPACGSKPLAAARSAQRIVFFCEFCDHEVTVRELIEA